MSHRMILTAITAILVVSCGGSDEVTVVAADSAERPAPVDDAVTIEQEVGPVWVIATFDPARPKKIDLAFDTHSVDLAFDIDASVRLNYDGTEIPIGEWDGTEPGGHHRWGTVSVARPAEPGQLITFTFTGLSEPVSFRWTMPGAEIGDQPPSTP